MDSIRVITDETELDAAQAEMGRLLEMGATRSPAEDSHLGVLAVLIRTYEDAHWALDLPDPILAIQSRMNDLGLQQTDLLDAFGNKASASLIMSRKRPLTLPMIRRLAVRLSLPIAVLAQEYALAPNTEAESTGNERVPAEG
jgi:HTH-type transcriptional regulator/antitoxin HigA